MMTVPEVSALRRQRQESQEIKVFLRYMSSVRTAWAWARLYLVSNNQTHFYKDSQTVTEGGSVKPLQLDPVSSHRPASF